MAGHNKWSKVKRKKAVSDAEKSKVFSKIVKLISSEAKKSGGVESAGLKTAIEKAKEANVPKDVIERAVKKAKESAPQESITYEAYGPGGVALIIEALTENRNKAAAEIKHILSKHGFSLASPGSATWAFQKDSVAGNPDARIGAGWQATTMIKLSEEDGEKLGALIDDLEENDEVQEVFMNAE